VLQPTHTRHGEGAGIEQAAIGLPYMRTTLLRKVCATSSSLAGAHTHNSDTMYIVGPGASPPPTAHTQACYMPPSSAL
jgi:hypothetical protein